MSSAELNPPQRGGGTHNHGGILPRAEAEEPSQTALLVSSHRVIQTLGKMVVFERERWKRRNLWFCRARAELKIISDLGKPNYRLYSELGGVVHCFEGWRKSYRNRYVHLSKQNKHVFIKMYSRFDVDYRQSLRKRLKLLDFMIWDLKIELTIDPKKFFRLFDEFAFISKGWNKLRSWLIKRYGSFEYFKVLEVQKSGRPHLHVLISGIRWVSHAELSKIWASYGGGEVVYIRRVWNRENVKMCDYVMKYVNKTLRNEGYDRAFSALLFASNRRLFSMSKGCQNMLIRKPKEKQGFVYEGTVLRSDLVAFSEERGLILGYYLFVGVSFEDMHGFPRIFCSGEYG